MTNADIARVFERIALILDLKGDENPFRIRAYERAAVMIQNLPEDLRATYGNGGVEALEALPGIGEDLAEKIGEMLRTGKLAFLQKLEKSVPEGLLEILEIEGIGPKRTKQLWRKFRVTSLDDLEKLAKSGRIEKLPGWGEKSVANILRGIDQHRRVTGRMPLPQAQELAEEMTAALRKTGLCGELEVAGSFRRRQDTVGDLDFLATGRTPAKVMDAFCGLPQVESVKAKGETKATVFLRAGLDADLRVVEPDAFGAALHYFTGSKDHNVHIRRLALAKGLTISEYGVYRGTAKQKGKRIASRTEEEVYRAVGLPFIPPELREDRGEIEAAGKGMLPSLVEDDDILSNLHVHSTFSDGADSMAAMAKAAKEHGFSYLAITDHASPMGMVGGIRRDRRSLKNYLARIQAARERVQGIHILAGAEVDILKDGSLYLPDDMSKEFQWVIAAVHQHFHESSEDNTERLRRACRNPFVSALGHPTTRLLGKRPEITFDADAVLKEAKECGTAVELNAAPERLDLPDTLLKRAKELGVPIAIGSDAHSTAGLDCRFGIAQARRGWLEKRDVVNTLPWEEFEKFLKHKPG